MTKPVIRLDSEGRRLCACCDEPVPESLGTKPRTYCSRTCRQRAYEDRLMRRRVAEGAAAALKVAGWPAVDGTAPD